MRRPLAPAYRISARQEQNRRVRSLARMMTVLTDRMSRLPSAWNEWEDFDPGAFFDLYPEQAEVLVDIRETRHWVRVIFFADVLVPAFREAEVHWMEHVVPALHVAQPVLLGQGQQHLDPASETWADLVAYELAPEMEEHLYRAAHEIQSVRELLYDWGDVTFLATAAGGREHKRVIHSGNGHMTPRMKERLHLIPTLTLELTFSPNASAQTAKQRALLRWKKRSWSRSQAK